MSIYIQVSIGLLLTLIGLLLIVIRRKYIKPFSILTILIALLLLGLSSYLGINQASRKDYNYSHQECDIYISSELILAGQFEKAEAIIYKLYPNDATNPHLTLGMARIKALEGFTDSAGILYEKAKRLYESKNISGFPENEYKNLANTTDGSDIQDIVVVNYLAVNNIDPENYGFKKAYEESQSTVKDIQTDIRKNIKREQLAKQEADKNFESFDTAAGMVIASQGLYENYLSSGNADKELLSKLVRRFKALEEEQPHLLQDEHVRMARLRVFVLDGSYKNVSNVANENACKDELMILSELYMKGLIKSSNFNEDFSKIDGDAYDKVISQCEKVYDEKLIDENKTTKTIFKNKIAALKNEKKHRILSEMKYRMISDIDNTPNEETSKLYLQLSKVENYLGNSSQADNYINLSISHVGDSEDMDYAAPMHEIIGIIEGKDDTETIKNVARYVEQVVENTLPIQIKEDSDKVSTENEKANFNQHFTNYISKKKAVINLGAIDKSNFPEIKARIQVDSEAAANTEQLKNMLEVYDCGQKIESYKLEKLEFKISRVLLLCDISGSMQPNVGDLKDAVRQFSENINEGEQISVIGFDDRIRFEYDFTDDMDVLNEAVGKLGSFNGTNMYSALIHALAKFPMDISSNNVIILMTDGQDNTKRSGADIENNIGRAAKANSVTIYTIGLGNQVDTRYLTNIGNSGNGKFVYVKDAESLNEFYSFIHNQLTNQYILTYTAYNTTDNFRELKAVIPEDGVSDRRSYYLVEPKEQFGEENYESIISEGGDLKIYGFDTKQLYKSETDMYVNLVGEGFEKDGKVSAEIIGNLSYNLKTEYVDANNIKVLIPGGIAVDVYDLEANAGGKKFRFNKELSIAIPGKEVVINYGPYVFTALQRINEKEDKVRLCGNVTLNGWLRFKGDIIITGNIQNQTAIKIYDEYGSYISYNKNNSLGLAKFCAEKGISIPMFPFYSFNLYNDEQNRYDFEKYRVDEIYSLCIPLYCFVAENASIKLYPDKIQFAAPDIVLDLPFQKELLKASGYNPFTFSGDINGVFSHQNIGIVGKIELGKDSRNKKLETFSIVNKLPLKLKETTAEIDTLKNDYSLKAKVFLSLNIKMPSSDDDDDRALGFEFAIKGMKLDKVMLYADFNWTPVLEPIPLTFSDFGLGLTDMSEKADEQDYNVFLDSYLTGQFDLSAYKLSAVIPKNIAEFLGDPVLLTISEATPKIRLREFSLAFNADIKVLNKIKVGYCDLKLGNFKYENALLGVRELDAFGIYFKTGRGIFWESANCNIESSSSIEYTFAFPYIGFWGNGTTVTTINWWGFEKNLKTSGDFIIAFFINSDNKLQFSIIVKDIKSNSKIKIRRLDLTEGTVTKLTL